MLNFFRQVGDEVKEAVAVVFSVFPVERRPVVGKPEKGYAVKSPADFGRSDTPVYFIGFEVCFKIEPLIMIQMEASAIFLRQNITGNKAPEPVCQTAELGVSGHVDDDPVQIALFEFQQLVFVAYGAPLDE